MKHETQQQIDKAYTEGKAAYFRAVGTHGPTLKPRPTYHSINPYHNGSKCHQAWQRGYNQDVRRVIAEKA